MRQAATLLNFARSTANPELSAALIEKANDLKSRIDEAGSVDKSHRPPDVEPGWSGDLRPSTGARR
jgi:hypothetical protein